MSAGCPVCTAFFRSDCVCGLPPLREWRATEPTRLDITAPMVQRLRDALKTGWPYRLEDVDLVAALNWAVNGEDPSV